MSLLTSDGSMTFSNHTSRLDAIQVGQLFHRFYPVENAKTSTGLGLNIAKLLTEQMGGTIRAEYEDGMIHVIVGFHSLPSGILLSLFLLHEADSERLRSDMRSDRRTNLLA